MLVIFEEIKTLPIYCEDFEPEFVWNRNFSSRLKIYNISITFNFNVTLIDHINFNSIVNNSDN